MTDSDLLAKWADAENQDAFRELVARLGPWVRGAALRRLGDAHGLADEAVQRVFTMLARKAAALKSHPCLRAWLHRALMLEAAHLSRQESMRQRKLAQLLEHTRTMQDPASPPESQSTLPELDEILERLSENDRTILILRHVEGRSFREIGALLGKNEAAAQKQGIRALERLSERLRRRSASVSASVLGAALAATLSDSASALTSSAAQQLASSATTGAAQISFLTTVQHTLSLMTYGKSTSTAVVAAILLLLASFGGSLALGRHQALEEKHAADLAAQAASAAAEAARTEKAPASFLAKTNVPKLEPLPDRLERLVKLIHVDLASRSVNFNIFNHGSEGERLVSAMASLTYDDVPECLAILRQWEDRPDDFETLAAIISALLTERHALPEIAQRLAGAEFLRQGKAPGFALGSAVVSWAKQQPKAAWSFYRSVIESGIMPFDPEHPLFPEALTQHIVEAPAAALAEMAAQPEAWAVFHREALGKAFEDDAMRAAIMPELRKIADDRTALLAATGFPGKHPEAAGDLLDWILTREWQRSDGPQRVLHELVWGPAGDFSNVAAMADQIDHLKSPEAKALIFDGVQSSMIERCRGMSGELRETLLANYIKNPSVRQRIAHALNNLPAVQEP